MTKAIALFSGGLDSILAAKIVQDQGVDVLGIAFVMTVAVGDAEKAGEQIKEAADDAGIPVRVIDISDEFLEMLERPKHGYGSYMNPCIDCKIFMMKRAKEIMKEEGASFIITGEVLGERPMSQNKRALALIKKESTLNEYLLRPLSAKLLEETMPEQEGLIDRSKLLEIHGRSRKPQLALAKKYGITKFSPLGVSCLLTDPQFSEKVKDLMEHGGLTLDNIVLIKIGRHFRLDDETKVIVGRDEKENARLNELKTPQDGIIVMPEELPGPDALVLGKVSAESMEKAAALVLSHSKFKDAGAVTIEYRIEGDKNKKIDAEGLDKETIDSLRI